MKKLVRPMKVRNKKNNLLLSRKIYKIKGKRESKIAYHTASARDRRQSPINYNN